MGKKPMKPPQAASTKGPAAPSTAANVPSAGVPQRGRAGAPASTGESPAKREIAAPQTAAPASAVDAVDVTAVAPLFNKAAPNVVQVPQATMRRLRLCAGMLCQLNSTSSGVAIPLVCEPATDVATPHVAIHGETLALLEGRECLLQRHDGPTARDLAPTEDTALVLHRLEALSGASRAAVEAPVESGHLVAAFHRRFMSQIVFDGMIAEVAVAGVTCRVRVDFSPPVPWKADATDYGRVSPVSRIACTAIRGVTVQSSDSTGEDTVGALSSSLMGKRIFFTGDHGMGKSHRLRTEVETLQATCQGGVMVISVDALQLSAASLEGACARLDEVFLLASAAAVEGKVAVVVMDDVDVACGGDPRLSDHRFHRHVLLRYLCNLIQQRRLQRGLHLLAAATVVATVAELVAQFTDIVTCAPPADALSRRAILHSILQRMHPKAEVSPGCLETVAETTFGFVPCDLASLAGQAAALAFERRGSFVVDDGALVAAQRRTRPSAIRNFEITVPNVRWSDIGGSDEGKRVLQECVAWSLGHQRDLFLRLGVNPPRGVLLYGPPGCSKTMLAKALACESKMNFISVKGPEVFSKWVGDSEKAVRDIFSKARAVAPCVVFIDELDGMCGKRGSGGVSDRVISQFLTELDGLPSAISGRPDDIVFVAATNRPDNIDPAVLRPGRIDRRVYVGLPQEAERRAIAAIALRSVPTDGQVTPEAVAAATPAYTGAEVVAVCKEAALQAIAEDEQASHVQHSHLLAALQRCKPRVSAQDIAWYKAWGASSAGAS